MTPRYGKRRPTDWRQSDRLGRCGQLEKAIDDRDRDVRVVAVRVLSERGHRAAFAKVEAAVNGKTLKGAELTEKTAFFEAYGLLAGSAGVATLKPLLETKGLLRRREDPETRACAAMALGKIGDEEAAAALRAAAAEEKDPPGEERNQPSATRDHLR